jgi:hypothetical protein
MYGGGGEEEKKRMKVLKEGERKRVRAREEASIQYSSFSEKKESCSLSSTDRREREKD